MVSLDQLRLNQQHQPLMQYRNQIPLDIFDSPQCKRLATQAIAHRHLTFDRDINLDNTPSSIPVTLVEDNYPGWLNIEDLEQLEPAEQNYQAHHIERPKLEELMPGILEYAHAAMKLTNEYLWGGAVGPNLDCSGLVQCAFGSQGIWMPRDAYQQEAFTQSIEVDLQKPQTLDTEILPGDLVFFGTPEKATHVAIYLGSGNYIHSSGKDQGRNGIGIDSLIDLTHPVSQNYYRQYRGCGRVMNSYCP